MSLILRSEFASYSSLNWANLKYWVSLGFLLSPKHFKTLLLPLGNWKEVE